MSNTVMGFALCGSFCTFAKAINQMKILKKLGYDIIPIMSSNAYSFDTRFGKAEDFRKEIQNICNREIIHTIIEAEPIGPKKMCDLLVVAPTTGNTLSKLANGITDTSVTMALKSHLRILRPVVLCMASNDGLGASARNIGTLINTKNIYFVPIGQDNPELKPNSLVADFDLLPKTIEAALNGKQIEPLII